MLAAHFKGPAMYGIKCNVRAPHRFMRMGALCWLVNRNPGGGGDRVEVVGMSRAGRIVHTWIDSRDLTNFRVAYASDERKAMQCWPHEELVKLAASLQERWGGGSIRLHAAAHGRPQV